MALACALVLVATAARALTGADVIAAAQARNGFAAWRERRSVVALEGFERDASRISREARVYERSDPRGEHRTMMEFTSPTDVRGTRYLHVSPRRARQEWWMWSPASGRPRKLGGTYPGLQRDEIFFMTDLSYSDLVVLTRIQQWSAAEGSVTLDGDDPLDGTTCDRLVLVPARDNGEFPCARYRLWFSRDDLLLRRAELDDPDGRLMKTLTCGDYFATGRFMTARRCVVEHPKTHTRSVITVKEVTYEPGLADDVFSIAHMSESAE
ncbi:MAG TPA: outer membrane lipoprotein-sorting protein [Candidatus Binatia bacterium]|nr:outer membrane lipoprotein-sorting protein [Candidatus Binatia bacterium]